MSMIRSAYYDATEKRLTDDPIVQAMAVGIAHEDRADLAHESGTPRHEFMGAANRQYSESGGTGGGHIGAVARALLMLLDEPPRRFTFETGDGEILASAVFRRFEIRPGVELGTGNGRFRVVEAPVPDPSLPGLRDELRAAGLRNVADEMDMTGLMARVERF